MSQPSPKPQQRSVAAMDGAIPRSTLRIPMPAGAKPPRPETIAAGKPLPKSDA
jgi:hypothetical protein